jgi:hypothetical protein
MAALAEWPSPETIEEAKTMAFESRDPTASQFISEGKISLALAIYLI